MAEEEQKKEVDEQKASSKKEESSSKDRTKPEAHVARYKKKLVEELKKLMKEYPIVGAVNMENMPASSLAKMRDKLRDQAYMFMTKRRIMHHAIEEAKGDKKGIEKLEEYLVGMPALLFTKENPFKLFKIIKQNKSAAAAKPGQIAPKDIVISAGPTPFAPGPIIGELGALGLKTKVEDGKIMIIEDSTIVKEGDEIPGNVASVLLRLGIEPMEIGLDLVAVYEDGVIYDKKVLNIDEDEFMANLQNSVRWAINLAVEIGYYTKETITILVPKAFRAASAVALEGNFMTDSNKGEILAKAERQAAALKAEAGIADAPVGKKEEPKVEEKTEDKSKVEEAPKEEKESVPPAPEEKKKEGGEEKAPVEEKKEEPTPEQKEEKKEEDKPETPKEVEKAEEEVKEEIEAIEGEVQEQKKEPKIEDLNVIEKEVNSAEKNLEEVDKAKQELPSTEKVIVDAIEKNKEAAEGKKAEAVTTEKIVVGDKEVERKVDPEKQKAAQESEQLYEQLKKEGTLRNVDKEEPKLREPLSPQDIIANAHKKMDEDKGVPSAHDLMKKKLQKQNK